MQYIYKDFTGKYYAGSGVGWANLPATTWTDDRSRAKLLSREGAERMLKYITGTIEEA